MSQYQPSSFDQPTTSPSKGMAIAGLVCAIFGCIPGVGIVGVVLGILAMNKAKSDPQRYGGAGIGLAAAIVGGVMTVLSCVLSIGIFLPALGQARNVARQLKSSSQMSHIGLGLRTYSADNKDWFPEAGADLQSRLSKYGVTTGDFMSPRAEPGASDSYIYIPAYNLAEISSFDTTVILYENPKYVTRGRINVLFADGHVEAFPVTELQRILDASPKPEPATTKPASGGNKRP